METDESSFAEVDNAITTPAVEEPQVQQEAVKEPVVPEQAQVEQTDVPEQTAQSLTPEQEIATLRHDLDQVTKLLAQFAGQTQETPTTQAQTATEAPLFTEDEFYAAQGSPEKFLEILHRVRDAAKQQTSVEFEQKVPTIVAAQIEQYQKMQRIQEGLSEFWSSHPLLKPHEERLASIAAETYSPGVDTKAWLATIAKTAYERFRIDPSPSAPASLRTSTPRSGGTTPSFEDALRKEVEDMKALMLEG